MQCVTFVVATQNSSKEFWADTATGQSLKAMEIAGDMFDTKVFANNKLGLSEVYNQAADEVEDGILVMLHDDVWIHDVDIIQKLTDSLGEWDVIGLAGSTALTLDHQRISWSKEYRTTHRGSVAHGDTPGANPPNVFGPQGPVLVLDGLFIAALASTVREIRFDEGFTFDGYDTDFSLACTFRGKKLSTVDITVTHQSYGPGLESISYIAMSNKLRAKWELPFKKVVETDTLEQS